MLLVQPFLTLILRSKLKLQTTYQAKNIYIKTIIICKKQIDTVISTPNRNLGNKKEKISNLQIIANNYNKIVG